MEKDNKLLGEKELESASGGSIGDIYEEYKGLTGGPSMAATTLDIFVANFGPVEQGQTISLSKLREVFYSDEKTLAMILQYLAEKGVRFVD